LEVLSAIENIALNQAPDKILERPKRVVNGDGLKPAEVAGFNRSRALSTRP
jgi:hypothetical protein